MGFLGKIISRAALGAVLGLGLDFALVVIALVVEFAVSIGPIEGLRDIGLGWAADSVSIVCYLLLSNQSLIIPSMVFVGLVLGSFAGSYSDGME